MRRSLITFLAAAALLVGLSASGHAIEDPFIVCIREPCGPIIVCVTEPCPGIPQLPELPPR